MAQHRMKIGTRETVALTDDQAEVFAEHGWSYVDGPAEVLDDGLLRPLDSQAKSAWVEWAVHRGAERTAAEGLTRQQLIENYG